MYRAFNLDLQMVEKTFKTIEEARQYEIDSYPFGYELQKFVNGKWQPVKGQLDIECERLGQVLKNI